MTLGIFIVVVLLISWCEAQPPNWERIYKETVEDVNWNREKS